MSKELDLFKDFKLEDFYKEQEEKDLDEAKREVEDIFRKYVQMTDKISIATIQRKLHIGYAKASSFVELLALKNIVSNQFGVRDIYDKKKLVEEAITYFPKIIRYNFLCSFIYIFYSFKLSSKNLIYGFHKLIIFCKIFCYQSN